MGAGTTGADKTDIGKTSAWQLEKAAEKEKR
jgi:hypothetical protein